MMLIVQILQTHSDVVLCIVPHPILMGVPHKAGCRFPRVVRLVITLPPYPPLAYAIADTMGHNVIHFVRVIVWNISLRSIIKQWEAFAFHCWQIQLEAVRMYILHTMWKSDRITTTLAHASQDLARAAPQGSQLIHSFMRQIAYPHAVAHAIVRGLVCAAIAGHLLFMQFGHLLTYRKTYVLHALHPLIGCHGRAAVA